MSKRKIGEPNASVAYQAKPGQYERKDIKKGMKIKNSSVMFGK